MRVDICPVCDSKKNKSIYSLFRNNKRVRLKLCLDCGFVFQDLDSREKYINYYQKEYRDLKPNKTNNKEQKLKKMNSLWDFICSEYNDISNPCEILDIGCSKGYLLDILKKNNYATHGIEPDVGDAMIAKNNHDIKQGVFDSQSFKEKKFNIITAFNVLEHVLEPTGFINNVYERLNDEGYLIVNIPCLDYLPIHNGNASLFHDGHVNFFSINVLSTLLEWQNFKIVRKIYSTEYNHIYRPKKDKAYVCIICKKEPKTEHNDLKNQIFVSESQAFFSEHLRKISWKEKIKQKIPYSWEAYFFLKSIIINTSRKNTQ